jgi:GAF domain-containing protein
MSFPIPENEKERVTAVRQYPAFGSPPEAGYDELADLAAQITASPIAFVNIVDEAKGWFKAKHGLPPEITDVPRGAVCCAHAICRNDILIVPDLSLDTRFKDLPFIGSEPFLKFYAGMPLINTEGYALGTLCVMDFQPRQMEFEQAEAVRRLARQVVAQLELSRKLLEVESSTYCRLKSHSSCNQPAASSRSIIHPLQYCLPILWISRVLPKTPSRAFLSTN